jgi:CheY-like chemotaxis protein
MIVAEGDAATAKAITDFLQTRRIEGVIASDGGEAILQIHRTRPDGVVLGGQLPGLSGSALAEIVRRTAELASVRLIRIATLEEPVGAPEFEAEHTLEPGDLPEGLGPILERLQIGEKPAIAQGPPEPQEQPASDAASEPRAKAGAAPTSEARGRRSRGQPTSSDPEIAAAERLARIIVSDIILYNDEKFVRGVEEGNVVQLLQAELEEASTLFKQRIPEGIRAGRDFLTEELERRAEAKRS